MSELRDVPLGQAIAGLPISTAYLYQRPTYVNGPGAGAPTDFASPIGLPATTCSCPSCRCMIQAYAEQVLLGADSFYVLVLCAPDKPLVR